MSLIFGATIKAFEKQILFELFSKLSLSRIQSTAKNSNMKFLLAFACVFATAMAGPIYGGSKYGAPAVLPPAQPVGLLQANVLAPAAVSYAAPSVAYGAPAAPVASSAYGYQPGVDAEALQLALLALSLPNPAADLPVVGQQAVSYAQPALAPAPALAAY